MSRPRAIRLEVSSFCQLRCPSCPTTSKAIHPAVGSGFLRLDDFRKLLDENPGLEQIELSNYGEIFLNPHLLQILELAHQRNVVLTAANGVNLNNVKAEVLDGLVKYRLRAMTCSIDAASQDTYKVYRVRGDFATVIANIKTINEFKKFHRSPYPALRWQFVVFGHNEHELPLARQMARDLDMEFVAKLTWDSDFSPIRDKDFVRRQIGVGAATREEYEDQRGEDYMQGICHQLWDNPQINWDGKVLGCCRNFWGDFGGNAFADGLVVSLNHEKMSYAKEMLLGTKPARADIPCTTCEVYLVMQKRGQRLRRDPARPERVLTIDEALAEAKRFDGLGRLPDAVRLYQQVLKANPNHGEVIYRLGFIANEVGDAAAAIKLLRRAVALRPDNAEAYQLLGQALQKQGHGEEAGRYFLAAKRLGLTTVRT
jgi:MoaA/NifB/PqqE/SkfB family radical SAM enzyme